MENTNAVVVGIAVERGNSVVHVMVGGRRIIVATNVVGFAELAKAGVPVISVNDYSPRRR